MRKHPNSIAGSTIKKGGLVSATIGLTLLLFAFSVESATTKSKKAARVPDDTRSSATHDSSLRTKSAASGRPVSPAVRALTGVTTSMQEGKLIVSAQADGPFLHQQFFLENPSRLVLDFHQVENRVPFSSLQVNTAKVQKIRVRQFQNSDPLITRMVLDLEEGHGDYEIQGNENSLRVTFPDSSGSEKHSTPPANPIPNNSPVVLPAATRAPAASASEPLGSRPEAVRRPAPVINDLSVSEIPLSAIGTETKVELAPLDPPRPPTPVEPKAATAPPPPSPVPPVPSPSRTNVITVTASQESQYTGHPLTLDLIDVPLVDFFRLMAEEGGINVVMDPQITGTISIKVVKVPWDQIFDVALLNNSLDKKIEGNMVRIAKTATLRDEAKQLEELKKATLLAADTKTVVKTLNYARASTFVAPLGDQRTDRGNILVDDRTNALILTDIPSALNRMMDLIAQLDVPQPQVEIEARIVSATRDFARDIGIQFGFVEGNLERVTVGGPNTFGTIGGTRPSATPTSTFAGGNTITGRGTSSSSASQPGSVSAGASGTGNYNVNIPAIKSFGGVGISIGNIFDTFLLDAAITAGESKGLAKLISQPKVTAQNNQRATITQGLRFPIQIVANNTVSIQFQNAALTLNVTPQITLEGNIVLDLEVENNNADFARSVSGVPSIRTSETKTRVLVTDGGTTVIGGILIDDESTREDRVPGLANLPILGNLFKRTSVTRTTQEVLFFITPRIVK